MPLDSLPSAAEVDLNAKAGAGKILKVGSLTKHDHLVASKAVVQAGGKKRKIQVGPDGKPVAHEE